MQARPSIRPRHPGPRRGFVLLAILVFILLLAMVTLSLLFRAQGDEIAGDATAGSEQAWAAAWSGLNEALRVAAAAPPGRTDWQDDAATFQARPVWLDGGEQWSFTIYSAAEANAPGPVRYGLADEAGKVNLNHCAGLDLSQIPRIIPAMATALRQFTGQANAPVLNPGDLPPPAEAPPATADPAALAVGEALAGFTVTRHGSLATLDELLLLPGVTRALLHGAPPVAAAAPAPGLSDSNAAPAVAPALGVAPRPDPGWDQFFTVWTRDPNRTAAGQKRCNLNDSNDPLPAADWPAGFSNYVAAVRAAKGRLNQPTDVLEATFQTTDERGVKATVASEITKDQLPLVLDLLTTEAADGRDGLLNVNTASSAVLTTLPGVDPALADAIVSARAGLDPERRATIAWLYQDGIVDADKFKALAPRLTARAAQFHCGVIGYGQPSGRFRVLEAVIDTGGAAPRIVYLRDLTRLGLPFSLTPVNPADPKAGATAQTRHAPPAHG